MAEGKKTVEFDTLKGAVYTALDELYEKDMELLYGIRPFPYKQEEKYLHTSEQSVVFRFGLYLYNTVFTYDQYKPLQGFDLDMEYNRLGFDHIKRMLTPVLYGEPDRTVFPDMILHRRRQKCNLLVMEFKSWWYDQPEKIHYDVQKIQAMMLCEDFEYQYGLFVLLGRSREEVGCLWVQRDQTYTEDSVMKLLDKKSQ